MPANPPPSSTYPLLLRRAAVALLALTLAACASRAPAPVEDRTARPAPPPAPARRGDTAAGARAGLAAHDVHGEARRHAVRDRARPRARLPRARHLEQHREPQPHPRRPGVARWSRRGPGATPAAAPAWPRRRCARCRRWSPPTAGRRPPERQPRGAAGPRRPRHRQLQDATQAGEGTLQRAGAARGAARADGAGAATGRRARRARRRAASPPGAATPPAAASEARPTSGDDAEKLDWIWPTAGKVVAGFSETANLKGIDIGGKAGQPVVASAPARSSMPAPGCAATASSSSSSTTRPSCRPTRTTARSWSRKGRRSRAGRRSPKWATPMRTA